MSADETQTETRTEMRLGAPLQWILALDKLTLLSHLGPTVPRIWSSGHLPLVLGSAILPPSLSRSVAARSIDASHTMSLCSCPLSFLNLASLVRYLTHCGFRRQAHLPFFPLSSASILPRPAFLSFENGNWRQLSASDPTASNGGNEMLNNSRFRTMDEDGCGWAGAKEKQRSASDI
ncbi:hypothetical protein AMTR_s05407p00001050 [Amborella trichopoda]|uniref:Uncharacterized protein n=1 Tax=Amborella trichopoda TaxID=13333 RepID=U5CZL5_AMBTC|nr:hypothetical protein AMTR_s05407p00001050 [Amborella trichopoda]